MKLKISSLAALLLAGSLLATGAAVASEDVLPPQVQLEIQPSGEPTQDALGRLALAVLSGKEAMRRLSGSTGKNSYEKDGVQTIMPEMECAINRFTAYASCYSPVIDAQEEAESLFTRLVSELQTVLASDRWRGLKKEPGIASIRSYTYQDRESNAHIDIDIVAQPSLKGPNSYILSVFWWPR